MAYVVDRDGGIQLYKNGELLETAAIPENKRGETVDSDQIFQIGAGGMVLLGLALSLAWPQWLWLSAFVGAGLVFAGVTGFCGLGLLLARMPWNKK